MENKFPPTDKQLPDSGKQISRLQTANGLFINSQYAVCRQPIGCL